MPASSGRKCGRPPGVVPTESQKKTIASLFAQNMSLVKIAQHTGISLHHVRCAMLQQGLTFASRYSGRHPCSKVTETDRKSMATMFTQGRSQVQIAQRFKVSRFTVAGALSLFGISGPRGRRPEHTSARETTPSCAAADYRQSPEINEGASVRETVHCIRVKGQKRKKDSCNETAAPSVESLGSSATHHSRTLNKRAVHEKPPAAVEAQNPASPEPITCAINCHALGFRCDTCRFHSDTEEQFISHFLCPEHERMNKKGVCLTCTGCHFKTRQPIKMILHAIKHQARSTATS